MSSFDNSREREERRKRDDFYRAVVDRDSVRATRAALSTESCLHYLTVRDAPAPASDAALGAADESPDAQACRWIEGVIASVSSLPAMFAVDSVLFELQKAFRFGPLYREKAADHEQEMALAAFDERKGALVKAILQDARMAVADKPMPLLEVSRLALDAPSSWSRCKMLATLLGPYGFSFQSALEDLGEAMYRRYRQCTLGGLY